MKFFPRYKVLVSVFFLLAGLVSVPVHAYEETVNSDVKSLVSYSGNCAGDTMVVLSPAIPNCTFAYIKSSDQGSDKTYSMLLAASLSGKKVKVGVVTGAQADNNSCMSSAPVCKIIHVTICKEACL